MAGAYSDLNELGNKKWITASCIDYWLLNLWKTMSHVKFHYLATFFIPPVGILKPTHDEIKFFRTFYGLPEPERPPLLVDVVYVLNTGPDPMKSGNHFCTIAFMPSMRTIYILCRNYMKDNQIYNDKDWESWDGKRIWTRVCRLFGWDEKELGQMKLCSVNWKQNGYDCGPIACQIVQHLMNKGLRIDRDLKKLPCCHVLRKTMAQTINDLIVDGFEKFDSLGEDRIREISGDETDYNNWVGLMDTLRRALEVDPASEVKAVVEDIDKAMMNCRHCQDMLEEIEERECPVFLRKKGLEEVKNDRVRKLLKGAKSLAALVEEGLHTDRHLEVGRRETEGEYKEVDEEEGEDEEVKPRDTGVGKWKGKARASLLEVDWTEARIGRFPRPKTVPELPQQTSLRGLNHPFDAHFDDYYNGPTMDALLTLPPEIMGYDASLVYLANRILINPWSTFKDFGYRLLPNYSQNYYLGDPVMFKDHLCPVGLPNPPPSITGYHLDRYRKDSMVMGAKELLELADGRDDDTVLLTGKIQDGGFDEYVVLDLQRDKVDPGELIYSCDIDSLIWITQKPRFRGPLGVYASPMIRSKAPIWKNNHVCVELLYPQSEEDREGIGPREEWWTKRWSLSNIPHLYFGTVSPGTSTADILLFFPRMSHQDPQRHFWANQIPKNIQNILWDRVITPALRSVLKETEVVYFPVDREHWRLKDGLGKNMKRVQQLPLQGERMKEVVEEMVQIVSEDWFFVGLR